MIPFATILKAFVVSLVFAIDTDGKIGSRLLFLTCISYFLLS